MKISFSGRRGRHPSHFTRQYWFASREGHRPRWPKLHSTRKTGKSYCL